MSAATQISAPMSIEEFLVRASPPGVQWQLVDGVPVAMVPTSPIHASIQNELGALLRNHLAAQDGRCRAYTNPGVRLGADADRNLRIPDLGVTCAPLVQGGPALPDPLVLVDILSPAIRARPGPMSEPTRPPPPSRKS